MSCTCVLSASDADEMVETIIHEVAKARQAYQCYECRQPIDKGQEYENYTGKLDGDLCHYRTCLLCVEIRSFFSCDGSWLWGAVWEDLREGLFHEFHAGCLEVQADSDKEPLSAAAKRKVVNEWRRWKGLTT